MKKILSILSVLVLLMTMTVPVAAAGSVTYDEGANKFIFKPGTDESPTNLFSNFQNVMPGDTLTEQITIKNNASKKVKIKVYLRSLGAQENTTEFLNQMKLTVEQKGDSILFSAPADETSNLTDWVYLGTLQPGGKITLDVTLEVPKSMGNKFQNQVGYIDWEFHVEEIPITVPQTGDNSNLVLYAGLSGISLLILIVLIWAATRKKKEQKR